MRPISDIKSIRPGMILENASRGSCTITGVTEDGWIQFFYEGLEGPDFKVTKIYHNADMLISDGKFQFFSKENI